MKLFANIWSWVKSNKFHLFSFLVLSIILVFISNSYIESEIDESYNEIMDEINYGIFENKKSFGVRNDSYTIVSYSKSSVPNRSEFSDSSSYEQQYGNISNYYKASGGWTIRVFKKENNEIAEITIQPYAVGLKYSSDSDPEPLFRRLYNSIISDEDYNIDVNNEYKITKLQNINTKFHMIESHTVGIDKGLMWYDYYDGKSYSQLKQTKRYSVNRDYTKISLCRWLYILISLIISSLLLYLFRVLYKRKKNTMKNDNPNEKKELNKTFETHEDSSKDIDDILLKLNPSNFMSPYDPEKVKIANDLYSALIQSQGNKTIVSMIKERASSELGVKFDENEN